MKPIVAIVGRPNVGKSTLFNKLAGKRISIVEDLPGVTRDRIYADCEWNGKNFSLVDTGGLDPSSEDVLLSKMREQAQIAIDTAKIIIFVTDIREGITATDIEVAEILQKSGKPIVLACNKSDTPGPPPLSLYEFYNLGLGEPIAVSSVHGMGTGDLLDAVTAHFGDDDSDDSDDNITKIAIVGRPNAGKSSLVNKLLGENRVIISPLAGTTRDAIDTFLSKDGKEYMLIDTAGMRKRSKVDENIEHYSVLRAVAAVERADVVVILIDAEQGVTEQDTKIAGLAHDQGRASIIAVNKWDLIEKDTNTQNNFKKDIYEKLSFMPYAPILFLSALTGQRVERVLETADLVFEQTSRRITTGALNDCVSEATIRVQPPSDKGKRLRLYYATQAAIRPPTFVFFVNDKELMHFSYLRYLENRIRETFDFGGTPIRFFVREKRE